MGNNQSNTIIDNQSSWIGSSNQRSSTINCIEVWRNNTISDDSNHFSFDRYCNNLNNSNAIDDHSFHYPAKFFLVVIILIMFQSGKRKQPNLRKIVAKAKCALGSIEPGRHA